jgi:hypothetical protein
MRFSVPRTYWLLFVIALSACILSGCDTLRFFSTSPEDPKFGRTVQKPAPPGKNSFRQPPFTFAYDFDNLKRDHPLFKDLEALRDQVAKELHVPAGTAPVQVYLFEDKPRFEKFMRATYDDLPEDRRAFFIEKPRGMGGRDLLVYTFWGDNARIQQDMRHECTHALLHSVLCEVPMWLDEGLAEYFELPAETSGLNDTHVEFFRRAIRDGSFKPDLARLEGLTQVKQMNAAEYREAWAWAHLMLRSTPEAKKVLRNYLMQLKTNPHPGALAPRLAEVFPSPEEALKKHLLEIESGK